MQATAYCQSGTTASGNQTRRGIVAADPRVLPLGTTIRIVAPVGGYSTTYRVEDTAARSKAALSISTSQLRRGETLWQAHGSRARAAACAGRRQGLTGQISFQLLGIPEQPKASTGWRFGRPRPVPPVGLRANPPARGAAPFEETPSSPSERGSVQAVGRTARRARHPRRARRGWQLDGYERRGMTGTGAHFACRDRVIDAKCLP